MCVVCIKCQKQKYSDILSRRKIEKKMRNKNLHSMRVLIETLVKPQ